MVNIVEVINFFVFDVVYKELCVVDFDDGFMCIVNEIFEVVMYVGLLQYQFLVFMVVMCKIYGFNKKFDWVSNEQFLVLIGIFFYKCLFVKSVLVKWGILI